MAHVILDGNDLGEVTDEAELAYYQREPGAVIDGVPVPVSVVEDTEAAAEPADVLDEEQPQWPGASASKRDKYDYAKIVDPDLPAYDDIIAADLDERYGVVGS